MSEPLVVCTVQCERTDLKWPFRWEGGVCRAPYAIVALLKVISDTTKSGDDPRELKSAESYRAMDVQIVEVTQTACR